MLSNGVVRPSSSPWASRVILVQKKDGAKRFVIDFRALNDCTKKDAYPLPDIRDILDKLDSSQFLHRCISLPGRAFIGTGLGTVKKATVHCV